MQAHNQAMVYLFGKLALECCQTYTICSLLKEFITNFNNLLINIGNSYSSAMFLETEHEL